MSHILYCDLYIYGQIFLLALLVRDCTNLTDITVTSHLAKPSEASASLSVISICFNSSQNSFLSDFSILSLFRTMPCSFGERLWLLSYLISVVVEKAL